MTHNSGIGSVQCSHVGGGFSEVGGGGRAEGGLKKGPWTAAEDTILMEYVRKHGEGDWNAVRRNSGLNRCGKSCRLRWANHLRPNLKKGAFSPEEERLILELHAKYGNKWARMAAQLPGRTDNEIKNYWNTRVKRRQRQGLPLYPIDIQQYSSQPTMPTVHSAPTTPTSLTSPTTQIFHFHNHSTHHSPIHSLSSTPTHLSPLNSPHQARPCFNFLSPTGPSANATATDHASSLAANSFTFHRPTPILQNPVRFFRNNQSNSGFQFSISPPQLSPAPLSPNQQCSSPVLVQQYQHQHQHQNQPQLLPSQLNDISSSSFQFPVSQTMVSSMQMLPQFKTEDVVLCGSVNSGATPELSSNQLSQNNTTSFYMTQYAKLGSPDTHNTGRGLLEDLLEEAQVLACENTSSRESCLISQDERGLMNSYHKLENSNSPHFFLGEKQMEEVSVCVNSADDDWSKLLNTVPSTEQVPNWYNDRGEISNGQSSGITDDMGLDMQHIASLFPTSNSKGDPAGTTSSCSWDNLPGICQGSGGF